MRRYRFYGTDGLAEGLDHYVAINISVLRGAVGNRDNAKTTTTAHLNASNY